MENDKKTEDIKSEIHNCLSILYFLSDNFKNTYNQDKIQHAIDEMEDVLDDVYKVR